MAIYALSSNSALPCVHCDGISTLSASNLCAHCQWFADMGCVVWEIGNCLQRGLVTRIAWRDAMDGPNGWFMQCEFEMNASLDERYPFGWEIDGQVIAISGTQYVAERSRVDFFGIPICESLDLRASVGSMSTYITKRAAARGLTKVDSKEPLLIRLRPSDIKKAAPLNSKECAFARAARRLPGVTAAYFFRTIAWLEYSDRIVRYLLPVSTQKEISSFDRSRSMAPGEYQLSSVPPATTFTVANSRAKVSQSKQSSKVKKAKKANRQHNRPGLDRNMLDPDR